MNNLKLVQMTAELQGKSAAEVDAILHQKRLDPQERVSVKLQLQAAAPQGRRVQAGVRLLTDAATQTARPATEMDRLLHRLDLATGATVTMAALEARMTAQDLDPQQRIAVKIEAAERGLLATAPHYPNEAARLLEHLGIDGPVSLEAIERQMDCAGYGPTAKAVVKSELQARQWLRMSSRTMQASRAVLKAADGTPLTLRSRLS